MWLMVLLAGMAWGAEPQRVVSTAPGFTETMFALGAGKRLIAVSDYCHYPAEVNKLPRVGSYLKPNVEAIARMKPDLVLLHSELGSVGRQFASLGIRTLALRNTNLEETFASFRQIGAALGMNEAGVRLERDTRARLAALQKASAAKPVRTLLFLVGRNPGRLDGMIAVGRGSFLNELIRVAGGRNVLFDSPVTYPQISLEGVVRLDPDVIVDMGDMSETVGVTEQKKASVERLWKTQKGVRAAVQGRAFAVAADIFVVPGPRVVDAAEAFARMLEGRR
ncbi:MAG: ABC transporter substrate-binding protein [Bryobacterales bacterium]|nr:ABC transporter substrate-binding protein [Bryobacterales bacterium]